MLEAVVEITVIVAGVATVWACLRLGRRTAFRRPTWMMKVHFQLVLRR